MDYTLKNVYVEKALQLGSSKNAKQLFLSMSKVTTMGNWDKREALFHLEDLILREDSMGREWLPGDGETFPKLTMHIQHIFKKKASGYPTADSVYHTLTFTCPLSLSFTVF